jgi:hypothetical protein
MVPALFVSQYGSTHACEAVILVCSDHRFQVTATYLARIAFHLDEQGLVAVRLRRGSVPPKVPDIPTEPCPEGRVVLLPKEVAKVRPVMIRFQSTGPGFQLTTHLLRFGQDTVGELCYAGFLRFAIWVEFRNNDQQNRTADCGCVGSVTGYGTFDPIHRARLYPDDEKPLRLLRISRRNQETLQGVVACLPHVDFLGPVRTREIALPQGDPLVLRLLR